MGSIKNERIKYIAIQIIGFMLPIGSLSQTVTDIPKTTIEINIDGELSVNEWGTAFHLNSFKQIQPKLGELAIVANRISLMQSVG